MQQGRPQESPWDNLRRLTKDELVWVIRRMEQGASLPRAVAQLEEQKQAQTFCRAEALYEQASAKRKEYAALVKEYHRKPIKDIPPSLLLQATQLLDEARRLTQAADKLCGI